MEPEPRESGLGIGWAALVLLFAASLLTVSAWLLQFARGWWRRARGRTEEEEDAGASPAAALWGLLGRLVPFRGGGQQPESRSEASGARALLASLFAFRAFRENWQRAWLRALNEQARRHGSSVQITFEDSPQQLPAVNLSRVTCADQSECTMLLRCHLSAESLQFPISVTQQSPAAVSMDAFQVTLAVVDAQLEIRLEEIQDGGLLVSWAFLDRPDLSLTVVPKLQPREDNDGKVDLSTIKELLADSVISTQPAMMVNLRAGMAGGTVTTGSKRPSHGSPSSPVVPATPRLLVQNLRALHLGPEQLRGSRQLCCLVEVDSPRQQKRTKRVPAGGLGPATEVDWDDQLVLETSPQSRELKLSIFSCSGPGEEVLLGFTAIPLASPSKEPKKQQLCGLSSGPLRKLPEAAALSVEMLYQDVPEGQGSSSSLRASITPTKKVEMDRTIMPDGTIVTTVTTIQSRPKMDCKIDSPSRSPSKVEVTEKGTTVLPENGCSHSASPTSSRNSHVSNGLDPVAETAIRQLTDLTHKPTKKTPTKRSTLIISGVSKVPLAQDEMALSLGYAASLDGLLPDDALLAGMAGYAQRAHSYAHPTQPLDPTQAAHELDEALRSDFSERVSVDDAESETGSTGALETRSLKDHKVSFLRSGTKLLFRRKNKPREAGLSLSHDDLPNTSVASGSRKKSGSFSRRLIKHFSFKSKPAAKANGGPPLALDRP